MFSRLPPLKMVPSLQGPGLGKSLQKLTNNEADLITAGFVLTPGRYKVSWLVYRSERSEKCIA